MYNFTVGPPDPQFCVQGSPYMDSDHVVFMKKICVSGHIEFKPIFEGQLYFENMYHVDWVLSCILQLGKFIVSRVSVSCKAGF